jgi:hypothetical protein
MARARNIKPSFFTNDALAECDFPARILFIGLWTIADRSGRLYDRPKKIKAEILPYDNCDIEKLLNQLVANGFIVRYKIENDSYIQIHNFEKHQNPHVKESESTIPAPDKHHTSPVQNVPLPPSPIPLTDSPIPHTPRPKAEKVSLQELSTEHIAEWLNQKRALGKYLCHDEFSILERFKDYCLSKGKKYNDYIAAYRNAFEWDTSQPKGTQPAKSKWVSAADEYIAKHSQPTG